MSYPENTPAVLKHMGFADGVDFDFIVDARDESKQILVWKGQGIAPTEQAITAAKPAADAAIQAEIDALAQRIANAPTFEQLVARVAALEAKVGP